MSKGTQGPLYATTAAAGVGMLQYKRGKSPYGERETLVRAILEACEDAGLDPADVDGFVSYGDDRNNEPIRLMPELGTKIMNLSTQVWGGGGGGLLAAFELAAMSIATGQTKAVIVFRALVEGQSGRLGSAVHAHHLNKHFASTGMVTIAPLFAVRTSRIIHDHPYAPKAVEALLQADYYHAANNPNAAGYGQKFDLDTYHASRLISEPLRLFDCSRENDGAGAVLMVSAEHARDLKQKPVYMLAASQGAMKGWGDLLENEKDFSQNGFSAIAQKLWARTGLTMKDMDCAQVYENFSYQSAAVLIEHGFTTWEAAHEDFTFENLIAPTGKLPVNTSGGAFAEGFIHGMNTAIEGIRQLRGQSSNPVPNAKTCLITGGPGTPSSSAIFANVIP